MRTIVQKIADTLLAKKNTAKPEFSECLLCHSEMLNTLLEKLPSGSGFDKGTQLDEAASSYTKLVFTTAFHHTDENGFYCGWSEHTVTVKPAFVGIDLRVSGRNMRDIKGYIADVFHAILNEEYKEQV